MMLIDCSKAPAEKKKKKKKKKKKTNKTENRMMRANHVGTDATQIVTQITISATTIGYASSVQSWPYGTVLFQT
jgi:hypothetical protein